MEKNQAAASKHFTLLENSNYILFQLYLSTYSLYILTFSNNILIAIYFSKKYNKARNRGILKSILGDHRINDNLKIAAAQADIDYAKEIRTKSCEEKKKRRNETVM